MILRLSVMPCIRVSDDPAYNLSFRVLRDLVVGLSIGYP